MIHISLYLDTVVYLYVPVTSDDSEDRLTDVVVFRNVNVIRKTLKLGQVAVTDDCHGDRGIGTMLRNSVIHCTHYELEDKVRTRMNKRHG